VVTAGPEQGEVWWADAADKRRPVLVVSRSQAAAALRRIVVAPITRTVRGIPTEISLDERHGLQVECCASFDNLQLIPKAALVERIGRLGLGEGVGIRGALEALADC
jgi:mRNA interferase MazF